MSDQEKKSLFPLTLQACASRTEALRIINWQLYGGFSDRRYFMIAEPHSKPGHFITDDGHVLPSRNGVYVPEAYQKFLERTWP